MMPKGHKSKHGYATTKQAGGLGFREIAEGMTKDGDNMNHSTARNILHRGLLKISRPLCEAYGLSGEELEKEASKVAADPRFQSAVSELLKKRQ
jgi:hypothetical protein